MCVCVVHRTRRGCQVGSLLLLCHYSSSLFHSFSNFLTQVSEIIFRVWCKRERLDEVKPFPDFSSLQSKLPPHWKIYPCPILEKPLDGKSAPIQNWRNHLMLLPPRSSWNLKGTYFQKRCPIFQSRIRVRWALGFDTWSGQSAIWRLPWNQAHTHSLLC